MSCDRMGRQLGVVVAVRQSIQRVDVVSRRVGGQRFCGFYIRMARYLGILIVRCPVCDVVNKGKRGGDGAANVSSRCRPSTARPGRASCWLTRSERQHKARVIQTYKTTYLPTVASCIPILVHGRVRENTIT